MPSQKQKQRSLLEASVECVGRKNAASLPRPPQARQSRCLDWLVTRCYFQPFFVYHSKCLKTITMADFQQICHPHILPKSPLLQSQRANAPSEISPYRCSSWSWQNALWQSRKLMFCPEPQANMLNLVLCKGDSNGILQKRK